MPTVNPFFVDDVAYETTEHSTTKYDGIKADSRLDVAGSLRWLTGITSGQNGRYPNCLISAEERPVILETSGGHLQSVLLSIPLRSVTIPKI